MIRSVLIDQGCSGEFNQMLRDRFNRAVLVLVRKEPGLSSFYNLQERQVIVFNFMNGPDEIVKSLD